MNDGLIANDESILTRTDPSSSSRSISPIEVFPSPPAFADIHIDVPSEPVTISNSDNAYLRQRRKSPSSDSNASTTSSDLAMLDQTFWNFAWDFVGNLGRMPFDGDRRRTV